MKWSYASINPTTTTYSLFSLHYTFFMFVIWGKTHKHTNKKLLVNDFIKLETFSWHKRKTEINSGDKRHLTKDSLWNSHVDMIWSRMFKTCQIHVGNDIYELSGVSFLSLFPPPRGFFFFFSPHLLDHFKSLLLALFSLLHLPVCRNRTGWGG